MSDTIRMRLISGEYLASRGICVLPSGGAQKNANAFVLAFESVSAINYRTLFDHLPSEFSSFYQSKFSITWTAPTGPCETSLIYKRFLRKKLLFGSYTNDVGKSEHNIQKNLRPARFHRYKIVFK